MSYRIGHDLAEFDFDQIIPLVQGSYWGADRNGPDIRTAFANSACVGLFEGDEQIAVARAITDGVFHAYIYDLIVFPDHRGEGHSLRLMDALMAHPQMATVKGWMLSTRDAHGIYEKYGFERVDPQRVMWMKKA